MNITISKQIAKKLKELKISARRLGIAFENFLQEEFIQPTADNVEQFVSESVERAARKITGKPKPDYVLIATRPWNLLRGNYEHKIGVLVSREAYEKCQDDESSSYSLRMSLDREFAEGYEVITQSREFPDGIDSEYKIEKLRQKYKNNFHIADSVEDAYNIIDEDHFSKFGCFPAIDIGGDKRGAVGCLMDTYAKKDHSMMSGCADAARDILRRHDAEKKCCEDVNRARNEIAQRFSKENKQPLVCKNISISDQNFLNQQIEYREKIEGIRNLLKIDGEIRDVLNLPDIDQRMERWWKYDKELDAIDPYDHKQRTEYLDELKNSLTTEINKTAYEKVRKEVEKRMDAEMAYKKQQEKINVAKTAVADVATKQINPDEQLVGYGDEQGRMGKGMFFSNHTMSNPLTPEQLERKALAEMEERLQAEQNYLRAQQDKATQDRAKSGAKKPDETEMSM